MLSSSLALSKAGGDLASQVATCQVSAQVYQRLNDAQNQHSTEAYLQKKRDAWQRRAQAALGQEEGHRAVLAWGVDSGAGGQQQ